MHLDLCAVMYIISYNMLEGDVMKKVRTIFMGTPVFACAILEQLYQEESLDIIALVSQPDRKVGRKQELQVTPSKMVALQRNTLVLQPELLKKESHLVLELQPDLIITCAYGQMIPDDILACAKLGAFNVHASLLPKLRGGAPIHKAIMFGETTTGITIMEMVKKMDAGKMISQAAIEILDSYTMGDLHDALMPVGAKLLHETLPSLIDGSYEAKAQDESLVTYAWNVSKEEEKVDFTKPYQEVYNKMRSLIPSPVSYGILDDKKIKFWKVSKTEMVTAAISGTILGFEQDSLSLAVDGHILNIEQLQLEGKQKMNASDFKNGVGKNYVGKVIT